MIERRERDANGAADPAGRDDDDGLVAEVRERLQACLSADGDSHREALDDLRFLSGEQWEPRAKALRERQGRPCLTINRLPSFLHQVTNDQRQNRPSIKVHPAEDGDVETAKVLQGLIRHIEYASNADVAYDTAVNSAAAIGFGFFRLVTQYAGDDSFDQEIRFKRIRNPFTVHVDPAAEEPDGSDARFVILSQRMARDEFKRLFPDADAGDDLPRGTGETLAEWLGEGFVRVAEYYRVEHAPATLVQLSNGETGWKDKLLQLPPGVTVQRERPSHRREVWWYRVTGCEVLERAQIPCDWIPVFPVWGDELDIDGRVLRSGMVRSAKDPARMYNVWMTHATEEIGMRPRTPFIGAEGSFDGHEAKWSQANTVGFSYLEYKPVVGENGQLTPPPQRQPMTDVPAGMLMMARHASDDIKATTGIFDASLGAQGNETSGRAITARQREGDTANFHYVDNLNRALRHAGRCLVNMIPRVYDTARVVRIMGEADTVSAAPVNQPLPQPKQDPKTGAIQTVLNDLSVGRYDVTVASGPSYSTLRQEAADAMIQFGQSFPKLMEVAGDLVVAAMDWPGADKIAARLKRTTPPQVMAGEDDAPEQPMVDTPQGPVPLEQAGQAIAQMSQELQAMHQELQDARAGIDRERIKADAAIQVAQIRAEASKDVEELKGAVAMLLQHMQPPPDLAQEVSEPESGTDYSEGAGEEGPAHESAEGTGYEAGEDQTDSRAMPNPGMETAQQGAEPDGASGPELLG